MVGRRVPAGHGLHALVPVAGAYDPAAQSLQTLDDGALVKEPAGH